MTSIDPTSTNFVVGIVIGTLGGMTVPTAYGMERLSGFGRWATDKLPYTPPPGKEEGEALEEATDES